MIIIVAVVVSVLVLVAFFIGMAKTGRPSYYENQVKPANRQHDRHRRRQQIREVHQTVDNTWLPRIVKARAKSLKASYKASQGKRVRRNLAKAGKQHKRAEELIVLQRREHSLISRIIGSSEVHRATGHTVGPKISRAEYKPPKIQDRPKLTGNTKTSGNSDGKLKKWIIG